MNRFFVAKENKTKDSIVINNKTDVLHIRKVLRMEIGDDVEICISNDEVYICELKAVQNEYIEFLIIEKIFKKYESNIRIDLFQGLPKASKMEIIIQKNTELGVNNFIPTKFSRCVSVFKDKKTELKKIDRWQKIAETAAKQSKRTIIPKVQESVNLDRLINISDKYDLILVAYESNEDQGLREIFNSIKEKEVLLEKIAIVIGPEGGFEESEINHLLNLDNVYIINLGSRILRTETAGFVVTSIVQYEVGDLG